MVQNSGMWYLKGGNEALPLIASQKKSASMTMTASGKTNYMVEAPCAFHHKESSLRPLSPDACPPKATDGPLTQKTIDGSASRDSWGVILASRLDRREIARCG